MKKNPNGFDPQRKKSYPKSIEENIKKMEDRERELSQQLNDINSQLEAFNLNKPFVGPKVVEGSGDVLEV